MTGKRWNFGLFRVFLFITSLD